jgi:hypothetical protein
MSVKHLDAVLALCLLLLWISSDFCSDPVSAEPSLHVGVKVGDIVKYGNFRSFWGSESPSIVPPQILYNINNTLYVVNTIQDISNSTVSFESRTIYRNGTEQVETKSVDAVYGILLGNLPFVAADLGAGDRVSLATELPPYRINSTSLREYCGVMRETNTLNVTQVYADAAYRMKLYWDKATGVLVEYCVNYTELTQNNVLSLSLISYRMVDNNMWIGVPDSIAPAANAGFDKTVDVGVPVVFDAGGSRDNVGITEVLWDFGDNESATGLSVSHIYDTVGVFNVTLTVEDGAGNKGSDYVLVTVQEPTQPVITPTSVLLIVALVVLAVLTSWLLVRRFSSKRGHRGRGRKRK